MAVTRRHSQNQVLGGPLEIRPCNESPRDQELRLIYNARKEEAERIQYKNVPENISNKVAEHLTFPTSLRDNRWMEVVNVLHPNKPNLIQKLEYFKKWPDSPFLLFLRHYFRTDDNNNLWTLISALWITKNCTDVLDAIETDISDFLRECEPVVHVPRVRTSAVGSRNPDLSFLRTGKCKKDPSVIRIFLAHTMNEMDVLIAEEIARNLINEEVFRFEPFLYSDALIYLNIGVGKYASRIIKYVDFVVPVLSRAYLNQIEPDSSDEFEDEEDHSVNLCRFHTVAQNTIIDMNSLNFLMRPVMCHDVNLKMAKAKCQEFRSALKYPAGFSRLVDILYKTKTKILRDGNRP